MIRHAHSADDRVGDNTFIARQRFVDDQWMESLSDRLGWNVPYTRLDLARPARLRRLISLQRNRQYPRKLLILLGLLVLAAGLTFFSSIFGDLTRSF